MTDIQALLREAAGIIELLTGPDDGVARPVYDRLIAAAEAMPEPVAHVVDAGEGDYEVMWADVVKPGDKLYLAPPPAVPEGFVLVPVEPTEADVGRLDWLDTNLSRGYGWSVSVAPLGNIGTIFPVARGTTTIRAAIDTAMGRG